MTIERIPTPESGLFDAPIRPAMYPQTPAIKKPTINTNGTAMSVRTTALAASMVDFANVKASHADMTRHTTVSARIHRSEERRVGKECKYQEWAASRRKTKRSNTAMRDRER